MDHTIIPSEWKTVLAKTQTLFPNAIIAGGALRDTVVDVKVKDIDIFICSSLKAQIKDFEDLFGISKSGTLGGDGVSHHPTDTMSDYALGYSQLDGIPRVREVIDMVLNGTQYQFIFVNIPPVKFVYDSFDFGICKIYFDGIKLNITDEFWYDFENKQLTWSGKFLPAQIHHTLFIHRVNLADKFPNWKFVIEDLHEIEEKKPAKKPAVEEVVLQMSPTTPDWARDFGQSLMQKPAPPPSISVSHKVGLDGQQYYHDVKNFYQRDPFFVDRESEIRYRLEDEYARKMDNRDTLHAYYPNGNPWDVSHDIYDRYDHV
jgi:hypothetical protein